MGRYWTITTQSGIICQGKFWFACQDSDDFKNIGFDKDFIQPIYYNCDYCCRYLCMGEPDEDEDWCKKCFDSREEYVEHTKNNNDDLYSSGSYVNYILPKSKYNLIDKWISKFKKHGIDKYIEDFESKIIGNNLSYDFRCTADEDSVYEILSARYSLLLIVKELIKLDCGSIRVSCEF